MGSFICFHLVFSLHVSGSSLERWRRMDFSHQIHSTERRWNLRLPGQHWPKAVETGHTCTQRSVKFNCNKIHFLNCNILKLLLSISLFYNLINCLNNSPFEVHSIVLKRNHDCDNLHVRNIFLLHFRVTE